MTHIIIIQFLLFSLLMWTNTIGQTTGKIIGRVTDTNNGEPIAGANVTIDKTFLGASTDIEGEFYIINIPPGKYTLHVQMIGYGTQVVKDISVSVNRTTTVNADLKESLIDGEEIVVVAEKAMIKKDQTSSIKNVSSEQIEALPVETIDDVVQMQTGIVQGHFRGGRSTEVSYLVDGVQTDEMFNRDGQTLEIETDAVQDVEVITGTFNAEYGKAMSGIVNMITKDGSADFHGSFTGYISNFYTSNSDVFIGLKSSDIFRNQDYKFSLSGPLYGNSIFFLINYRYQDQQGHLNGINRFEPGNYTNFITRPEALNDHSTPWDAVIHENKLYSEHTGDDRYVPMNSSKKSTIMAKLTFKLWQSLKFSIMGNFTGYNPNLKYGNETYDTEFRYGQDARGYNHSSKYRPYGRAKNYEKGEFYLFSLNHLLSNSLFYDLKISYQNHKRASFLYNDPFDTRYVSDGYDRSGGGFITGGQEKSHWERIQKDFNIKMDFTWQINKNHSIKSGALFTNYSLNNKPNRYIDIRQRTGDPSYLSLYYDPSEKRVVFSDYTASILPDSAVDEYIKKPYEFAYYLQDKMEFEELVINFGLRYDYFNSNTVYPTDLRNPDNLQDRQRVSEYKKAKPQQQVSPRFGLSYTLGKKAVLHFSYGHFFQMPPLSSMYSEHLFLIPTGDFKTVHGNPNIKAERTVQYETGIWLELMKDMGLELSVFYRDIFDLQSAIVVTTYSGRKYGVYSNKDYGNAKGMELSFNYRTMAFFFNLNYTLQYTRGVADNPQSTFDRLGDSIDPISRLTPMIWDQRHTANFTVGYSNQIWGVALTTYYNSGLPYTYQPVPESTLAKQDIPPNGEMRPSTISLDLKTHYDFKLVENINLRLFLSIYNLLDTKNELFVNPTTGRAYTAIVRESDAAIFRSNYNDIFDGANNPDMFSAPREIKLGLGIRF